VKYNINHEIDKIIFPLDSLNTILLLFFENTIFVSRKVNIELARTQDVCQG
jgi:hypothetical protein